LMHDPHSPSEARVNVPLMNFRPWRQAFRCPKQFHDPYAQCTVW